MTHYDISYKDLGTPEEKDAKAIQDIREYLSQDQWDALQRLVGNPATEVQTINFALAFAGVQGYPFHAFCRKYMLEKYRAWMAEEPDPIVTDEKGYAAYQSAA